MVMGLLVMVAGLVLFLGPHVFTTRRAARANAIAAVGEGSYKIIYTVVTLAGLALICWGFSQNRADGWIQLWTPPKALKHLNFALMLPAVILVVAAYLRGHIYSRLKHPMLAGVKLWAFGHLLANGDLGGIVLFGSILAWAVYDRISIKRRADTGGPAKPVGGIGNEENANNVAIIAYLALAFAFHPV